MKFLRKLSAVILAGMIAFTPICERLPEAGGFSIVSEAASKLPAPEWKNV